MTSDHNLIRVDVGDAALVRESRGALPSRCRARAPIYRRGRTVHLFIGPSGPAGRRRRAAQLEDDRRVRRRALCGGRRQTLILGSSVLLFPDYP